MGKRTQANPKSQPKPTKPKTPTKTQPKAGGRFPIIQTVFPLYGGETGEKSWLHTIYGLEFATKVCQEGQRTSGVQRSQSKGLRSTLKTVTKRPLHRVANRGNWVLCRSCSDCQQV